MAKSNFKIHFLPRAEDDLDEILTFISAESESLLQRSYTLFEEQILSLIQFPYSGHFSTIKQIKQMGYRLKRVLNYTVYYKIEDDNIIICRILHNARDHFRTLSN